MRAIVSTALATMLLLHAALGCCWHCGCGERHEQAQTKACSCCSHACSHHKHQEKAPQSPCKCRVESCAISVYVPTERVEIEPSDIATGSAVIECGLSQWCCFDEHQLVWRSLAYQQQLARPPVDLQVLHQSFLI